jgi:undecaprenyl-diphosphatase
MRASRFLYLFIFLFIAFGLLGYDVKVDYLASFDKNIITFANSIRSEYLTKFLKVITSIGSWNQVVIILGIILIYLLWKKHYYFGLFIVLVNALSPVLNSFLKNIFQRPRPNINPYFLYKSFSFPSGHATSAIVLFSTLCFLIYHLHSNKFKPFVFFSILMVGLIGFSRVYLGVHFPTDVLGGFLIGSMWLMLTIFLFNNFGHLIFIIKKVFNHNN